MDDKSLNIARVNDKRTSPSEPIDFTKSSPRNYDSPASRSSPLRQSNGSNGQIGRDSNLDPNTLQSRLSSELNAYSRIRSAANARIKMVYAKIKALQDHKKSQLTPYYSETMQLIFNKALMPKEIPLDCGQGEN